MPDRFVKIRADMGLQPIIQKQCHHPAANVRLETIGKNMSRVTLFVSDEYWADNRKDGGHCVTYWEAPHLAEKMYDLHLGWVKTLPLS